MKHVLMGLILLSSSLAFGNAEVARHESEISGMSNQRQTCEEKVKALQQEIAELTERIARAQSALETKRAEVAQKALPAPVVTTAAV